MIDTHAHLYLEHFSEDIQAVEERALNAGITKILLPNIDEDSVSGMFALRDKKPDLYYPMLGLHPCSVKKDYKKRLDVLYGLIAEEKIYGIGETGLDYYWDKSHINEQQDAFQTQIGWAKELGLPIVIHSRDSMEDTIKMISNSKDESLNGVFHCFTGTTEQANEIQKSEFYMGIGGVATFKNGGLDKVLPSIQQQFIILETDSPYLAPVPYRGKRNESSYITFVAAKVAEMYTKEADYIDKLTTANAERLFFS